MMTLSNRAAVSRRHLLKLCGTSALAMPLLGQRVMGANNTVRLGLIGCGGRMGALGEQFSKVPDVAIAALCDPDTEQMDSLVKRLSKREIDVSQVPKFKDYRKLLELNDIDAVLIGSPNHWHTLHAIQAMQAGKDVYVEKPVNHSLWEGQQIVAAEQKFGRIIAAGFQNRSDPGPRDGFEFVRAGNIGKIRQIHVCCFRERTGIGKRETPLTPPASIDYNLWLGPAADLPILRDEFHYDWHWNWNTGNGEVGNQTPHEIDLANWLVGDPSLPTSLQCFGGRVGWNDAGETPNMLTTWFELGGIPVIVEVNDLHLTPTREVATIRDTIRVGLIVRCEGGQLRGGRGGTYAVAEDGKTRLQRFPGNGGAEHMSNFIEAVRSRRSEGLASRIAPAVRSAAIAHLANTSFRSGACGDAKALDQVVGGNDMLRQIVDDQSKQLADWGIKPAYTIGKALSVDPARGTVTTEGIDKTLLRRDYRKGFAVPELA